MVCVIFSNFFGAVSDGTPSFFRRLSLAARSLWVVCQLCHLLARQGKNRQYMLGLSMSMFFSLLRSFAKSYPMILFISHAIVGTIAGMPIKRMQDMTWYVLSQWYVILLYLKKRFV